MTKLLSVRIVSSCIYSFKIVSHRYVHLSMFNDNLSEHFTIMPRFICVIFIISIAHKPQSCTSVCFEIEAEHQHGNEKEVLY